MAKDQPTDWPALTYETRPWRPEGEHSLSHTQRRKHQGSYQAALVPSIATRRVQLPGDVLAHAEEAAVQISRFDAYAGSVLGGTELGPMGSILLRSESSSSSQIENLTVGARQLAIAEIGGATTGNARLVAANVATMQAALDAAGQLDQESILTMHRALLGSSRAEQAGTWRGQQVWIGGGDAGPHHAEFVPPHHEHVTTAIDDLVRFMARDDLSAMVLAAVAHAQFETIHPFIDGNGRTGRAIVHALLRARGVTESVTVPVSAGLLTDTESYFGALGAYRAGDPGPIVTQLSAASLEAITNGRALVRDISEVREDWRSKITARKDAAAWRLAELLLRRPVVNARTVQHELGVSIPTALSAIDHLVTIGALVPVTTQARNRAWQAREVLDALDAFAARAGRRRRSG